MTHCGGCGYLARWHEGPELRCPGLKTKRWQDPPPVDRSTWREILARDTAMRHAVYDARSAPHEPEIILPPQVPARAPHGPGEIAGYQQRQALGLGRKAAASGWRVTAHYAMAADGAELSAVRLARDDLRAVATWRRAPGKVGSKSGWSADVAYGWRLGTMPAKINHTDLERFIDASAADAVPGA
jgi:hypothetical protein